MIWFSGLKKLYGLVGWENNFFFLVSLFKTNISLPWETNDVSETIVLNKRCMRNIIYAKCDCIFDWFDVLIKSPF